MLLSNPQLLKWAKALINRHDYEVATRDLGDDKTRQEALEWYDRQICSLGPVMTENLASKFQYYKPPPIDTSYAKGGPRKSKHDKKYKIPDPSISKPMAVVSEKELYLLPSLSKMFIVKDRLDDLPALCNRIRKKVRQEFGPGFVVYFDRHNDDEGVTVEPLEEVK